MNSNLKATILLLLTTVFWGGNFVIGKVVVQTIPPFIMAFFRWGIALVFLGALVYKEGLPSKLLIKKYWLEIGIMALSGISAFNTLVYFAVKYTTSVNAALVNALSPMVILILSTIVIKEKLGWFQGFGGLLSFLGVLTVISRGDLSVLLHWDFNLGDLLMIIAVILWGIYSILMKKVTAEISSIQVTSISAFIGWIALIPFALYEYIQVKPLHFNLVNISGLLYIGIFASFLAFLWWNKGVIQLGAGKAAVFLNLIPFFAALLSYLFLKDQLVHTQIIGGILIISGVMLANSNQWMKHFKQIERQ